MFKKILYPTDFSDVSQRALDYIRKLKASGLEEVIVLHVMEEMSPVAAAEFCDPEGPEGIGIPGMGTPPLCDPDGLREEIAGQMENIEKDLKDLGLAVQTRIETGSPLDEILKIEDTEAISLIILGSHGKSAVGEMILGSVSEAVIRKCKTPVLVIKR